MLPARTQNARGITGQLDVLGFGWQRHATSMCGVCAHRENSEAMQWLNLVDFLAIAPYYVSLRCSARRVFHGRIFEGPMRKGMKSRKADPMGRLVSFRWPVPGKYRRFASSSFGESVPWTAWFHIEGTTFFTNELSMVSTSASGFAF